MHGGNLEGLKVILDKEPLVPTVAAQELLDHPDYVEATYERHVRTYVALEFLARSQSEEGNLTRRLVSLVRSGKAPIGCLTAEPGYGKTSTALYLWHYCQREGLLAVPPFTFTGFEDLVAASYGWASYQFSKHGRSSAARLQHLYEMAKSQSEEELSQQHHLPLEAIRALMKQGRLTLGTSPRTAVQFLKGLAAEAVSAGFQGLVVFADEVQQYLDTKTEDPYAKLFDFVNRFLVLAEQRVATGVILVIHSHHLASIESIRPDLVQRLKRDRFFLDMQEVYTKTTFPRELVTTLATEFRFASLVPKIIDEDTLRALGEMLITPQLLNGPRSVVETLKLAVSRYLERPADGPLRPDQLVGSWLDGNLTFVDTEKVRSVKEAIQKVALSFPGDEHRQCLLFMAAFPQTGLTSTMAERRGLATAFDDLKRHYVDDLITMVGGGVDDRGRPIEPGLTLTALLPPKRQDTWTRRFIRQFLTYYSPSSKSVRSSAYESFGTLIASIFEGWRPIEEKPDFTFDEFYVWALRGSFEAHKFVYPDRTITFVLSEENRPTLTLDIPSISSDLLIWVDARLSSGPNSGRLDLSQDGSSCHFTLNFLWRSSNIRFPKLEPYFEGLVAATEVTPLLLLALHNRLASLVASEKVPPQERADVQGALLGGLLEGAEALLFGPDLERPFDSVRRPLFEQVVLEMCQKRYPQYTTLVTQSHWRAAIRDYQHALGRVRNPSVLRGTEPYAASKSELAQLFGRTVTNLEPYLQSLGHFVKVSKGNRDSWSVTFTMHPAELAAIETIKSLGRPSSTAGGRPIWQVPTHTVERRLAELGYLPPEAEAILETLAARNLVRRREDSIAYLGDVLVTKQEVQELLEELISTYGPLMDLEPFDRERSVLEQQQTSLKRDLTDRDLLQAYDQLEKCKRKLSEMLTRTLKDEIDAIAQWEQRNYGRLPNVPSPQDLSGAYLKVSQHLTEELSALRQDLLSKITSLSDKLRLAKDTLENNRPKQDSRDSLDAQQSQKVAAALRAARQALKETKSLERDLTSFPHLSSNVAAILTMLRTLQDTEPRLSQIGNKELLDQFAKLRDSVLTGLQNEGLDAIHTYPEWQEQLHSISKKFDEMVQSRRRKLAGIQEGLQRFLGKANANMTSVGLDPYRMGDSLANISGNFKSALEQALSRHMLNASEWRKRIQAALRSSDNCADASVAAKIQSALEQGEQNFHIVENTCYTLLQAAKELTELSPDECEAALVLWPGQHQETLQELLGSLSLLEESARHAEILARQCVPTAVREVFERLRRLRPASRALSIQELLEVLAEAQVSDPLSSLKDLEKYGFIRFVIELQG